MRMRNHVLSYCRLSSVVLVGEGASPRLQA
nr:MAG TPA: hypothetical protein [Caudoviricetes sp.]